MEKLETRMDGLEARMDGLETRMDGLETKMDESDVRFEQLKKKMQEMNDGLEAKIQKLDSKLDCIKLRIENEVIHAVHIIAEGHIDLRRHLDEAQADRREREAILLRILNLEYEVKEIKRKQACTA